PLVLVIFPFGIKRFFGSLNLVMRKVGALFVFFQGRGTDDVTTFHHKMMLSCRQFRLPARGGGGGGEQFKIRSSGTSKWIHIESRIVAHSAAAGASKSQMEGDRFVRVTRNYQNRRINLHIAFGDPDDFSFGE